MALFEKPTSHWLQVPASETIDVAFNTHQFRRKSSAPLKCNVANKNGGSVISNEGAPVEWAMLMYELDDAREHLQSMMSKMTSDPSFDESVFRIDLGHIFSHLNRAWNRRDLVGELDDHAWQEARKFPTDLDPI